MLVNVFIKIIVYYMVICWNEQRHLIWVDKQAFEFKTWFFENVFLMFLNL